MIAPLRKCTLEGVLYTRRPGVEVEITALAALPEDELAVRCSDRRKDQAGHVSTEALLHFVRSRKSDDDNPVFARLYALLAERVLRALPLTDGAGGESLSRTLIRERVFDTFRDWLLEDRRSYDQRLDYFEVNFNSALASRRVSAQRQVWREENRSTTLESPQDDGEIAAEVEEAAGSYDPFSAAEFDDARYRSRLDAAIDALPPLQSRIVEMLRQGFPIDSKDPEVVTIRGSLGKVEKTIRNQRDNAFAILRDVLTGKGKA